MILPRIINDIIFPKISHPWKVPGHTLEDLLCPLDRTFQSTVGERVFLVEVKIAFVSKETVPSHRGDVLDVICGDNRC